MKKKTLFSVMLLVLIFVFFACSKSGQSGTIGKDEAKEKVKFSLHAMSKCSHGVRVFNTIKPVLDQMGSAVDFELNYIGSERDGKWMPMHGEPELKGDKISLCAKRHLPKNYTDLVFCMNKEFRKIPNNFESCANELKLNVKEVKACVEGEEGQKLVEESYKFSKSQGAHGSPTIFIAGKRYNGGRGKNEFMRAICKEYKTDKPQACLTIPEPPKVKVAIISDKRCPECDANRLVRSLKDSFPGLVPEILDYSEEKGKAEYAKFAAKGHKFLPIVAFDPEVKNDSEGFPRIQRFTIDVDGSVLLRIGAKFDPTKEICDNKIDDTNDGKIDCDDKDCKDELICRKEIPGKVDLFVMSQCSYGTMALDAMKDVFETFKNDKLDFSINFIADETEPGKFRSLHGQPEIDEDVRELCAIKRYPKNYMDYIWCRNKNIKSSDWKSCATDKIKADVIEKCFVGGEGVKLLAENIKIGNAMQIGGSPTWIINNKFKAGGVSAQDIQNNICRYNPKLKGCAQDKKIVPKPGAKPTPKGSC